MSKTFKIILGILSGIGILTWGACVFIGVHFASNCSWPVSISAAVGTVLLMGFFFTLACYNARPQAYKEYGAAAGRRKWIYFGIYMLVSIASVWYLLHAVACFTTYKDDIQHKAGEEFTALRTMTSTKTDEPGSYRQYVGMQLANYRNANPNNYTNDDALEQELTDLKDLYLSKSGFPRLSSEIIKFGQPASYAVEHWDIFTVSAYVHELDAKKGNWDSQIAACANTALELEPEQLHTPYEPLGPTYSDLSHQLLTPSTQGITIGGIIAAIVLQIVILLSWLNVCVAPTHSAVGIKKGSSNVGVWNK